MNTISSSEIKRRGIGAVDELMENGPVHVIRNNTPDYVVLTEESYKMIIDDLLIARLDASDKDIKEGRVKSGTINDLMQEMGLEQQSNSDDLSKWADEVIAENPKTAQDFRDGKEKVLQFLMGQVMKKSNGAANPPKVLEILKEKLSS